MFRQNQLKPKYNLGDWSASVPLAMSVASTRKVARLTFKSKAVETLFRAYALNASGTLALQSASRFYQLISEAK